MFCRTLRIVHLVPSDYHLFRSLKKSLMEKISQIRMPSKFTLNGFSRKMFWEKRILDLLNRWAKMIEQKVYTSFNKDLCKCIF